MDHELVKLFKRAFVEQKLDALARRHLSGFVLLFDTSATAALLSFNASLAQCLQPGFGRFRLLF
jgi:hypothetical protein